MKRAAIVMGAVLVLGWLWGGSYELIDDWRAIKFARQLNNPVVFDPAVSYQRVNQEVDQFAVPVYLWSARQIYFHNWLWRYRQNPVMKGVFFYPTTAQPQIIVFRDEGREKNYLRSEKVFSDGRVYPFQVLGGFKTAQPDLIRGARLRIIVVTGAAEKLPTYLTITEGMRFAQNQSIKNNAWFESVVNERQIPITKKYLFPISGIYFYPPE